MAQFQAEKGERIPAETNAPGFACEYNLTTKTTNAEKVEVAVSDAGTLTMEQADSRYSKLEQQLPATLAAAAWDTETKTYSFEEAYPSETYNLNVEPIDCTQEQALSEVTSWFHAPDTIPNHNSSFVMFQAVNGEILILSGDDVYLCEFGTFYPFAHLPTDSFNGLTKTACTETEKGIEILCCV